MPNQLRLPTWPTPTKPKPAMANQPACQAGGT
jgi:hypothetical protein